MRNLEIKYFGNGPILIFHKREQELLPIINEIKIPICNVKMSTKRHPWSSF